MLIHDFASDPERKSFMVYTDSDGMTTTNKVNSEVL